MSAERLRECVRWLARIAGQSSEEVCGLLYGHANIAILNVSGDPVHEFAMDGDEQLRVMTEFGWPLAVWHTHPGGTREPSTLDLAGTLPGVSMIIGWPGGGGVWLNGQQTMEVVMTEQTVDIGELYQDEGGQWRWRRVAPNGATIASSGESFDSKSNAARALYRANPDLASEPTDDAGLGAASDALGGATAGGGAASGRGSTGGGTPAPSGGAPGAGSGSNAYGVGPTTTT